MKGQIFIITSVLILVALLITRLSTNVSKASQDETFYESYSNLKNELIKTIDVSLLDQPLNLQTNLNNFIDFSTDVFKRKGYTESVSYSISGANPYVVYLNVSLSSDNSYLLESLIINRTVYS